MANQPGDVAYDTHVCDETIAPAERAVLRRLAGRVAELAAREVEQEKRRLWSAHNDLASVGRPLIFCDPENGWTEIITDDQMECAGELARQWEYQLRKEITWGDPGRHPRCAGEGRRLPPGDHHEGQSYHSA